MKNEQQEDEAKTGVDGRLVSRTSHAVMQRRASRFPSRGTDDALALALGSRPPFEIHHLQHTCNC